MNPKPKQPNRKCFKCGKSSADDPSVKLFRFPIPGKYNIRRCEAWAQFCLPNGKWSSMQLQRQLYREHRMLCNAHFRSDSFMDSAKTKLRRLAEPVQSSMQMWKHKENLRTCVKCGSVSSDDPKVVLYRFPKPGLSNVKWCELWAVYCFPSEKWSSPEFLRQLHSSHIMLCSNHFSWSCFSDFEAKKLHKHAAPEIECLDKRVNQGTSKAQPSAETILNQQKLIDEPTVCDPVQDVDQQSPNIGQTSPKLDHLSSNIEQHSSFGDAPGCGVESSSPSPEVEEEPEKEIQPVTCHECHTFVEGYRFACVSCDGCVVCVSCASRGVHPMCYVLRVPPLRPLWEVQAVLRAVRGSLSMSAFADRLAEPLADYSINEIKSEHEDDSDCEMDRSNKSKVEEDEDVDAAIEDPLRNDGADAADRTEVTPFEKTPLVLSIECQPGGDPSFVVHTTADHMSQTSDMETNDESQTDIISRPEILSPSEDIMESDYNGSESEASVCDINTNVAHLNVPEKRVRCLPSVESPKCKVKYNVSKPTNTPIFVKCVMPSNVDISKLRTYKVVSADALKGKLKTVPDVKARLLTRLGVLPVPPVLPSNSTSSNQPLHSNVTSAESPGTKRIINATVISRSGSLHATQLNVTPSKETSAAVTNIKLGIRNEKHKILIKKRPHEVTFTPVPSQALRKFMETDTSKDQSVSRDLMFNIAQNSPKVKIVKLVETADFKS